MVSYSGLFPPTNFRLQTLVVLTNAWAMEMLDTYNVIGFAGNLKGLTLAELVCEWLPEIDGIPRPSRERGRKLGGRCDISRDRRQRLRPVRVVV